MTATNCTRCGHSSDHHRLDDSLNLDPTDPATPFRCIWPLPDVLPQACNCPAFVTPEGAANV